MASKVRLALVAALVLVMAFSLAGGTLAAGKSEKSNSPGQYIVVLKSGVDPGSVARAHDVPVTHLYTHALNGFAGALSSAQLNALKADARVNYIERDKTVHAWKQTLPTGVDRIEADKNDTADIDGVDERVSATVAIIDTGIDLDHPDLNVNTDLSTAFNTQGKKSPDDQDGHGTHVAGIAGALDNDIGVVGVAPGVELVSVRVLGPNGSGYLSDVIDGVDYVTKHSDQIEVANMSLGAEGYSQSLRDALTNSTQAGVVYTVAAGNDEVDVYGEDGDFKTDDDRIPAAYPEVAAISAMADSDGEAGGNGSDTDYGSDDSFASFSNFSQSVVDSNPVDSPGAAMDLLLPGVEIYSTYLDGDYTTMSGTSMSSPHGAGLAALYIAKNGRDADGDGNLDSDDVNAIRQALIDNGVAQDSSDGLATLNDPDDNWENIGWASSTVGEPPTVSWVNPKDGDTVSGTVTIQIDASDTEDSAGTLKVEWRVDDASWQTASYNSDSGYYEDSWDSTSVSDGDHTLDAKTTDSDGNTASASITVTTENTDNAPSVSWVNPEDGDTVKDTVTIKIDASDDRDSGSELTVEWQVDDGTWKTASYNSSSGYYEDSWDTTSVSDGDHNLDARATDTAGNTSSEKRITVTVNNEAGGMYVWDIGWKEAGPHLKAIVTILVDSDEDGIAESSDDPVSDASVGFTLTHDTDGDGNFESSDDSQSYTGTTDSKGQVEFMWKQAPSGKYKGEVTELTHDTYQWDSSMDADNPDYYTK